MPGGQVLQYFRSKFYVIHTLVLSHLFELNIVICGTVPQKRGLGVSLWMSFLMYEFAHNIAITSKNIYVILCNINTTPSVWLQTRVHSLPYGWKRVCNHIEGVQATQLCQRLFRNVQASIVCNGCRLYGNFGLAPCHPICRCLVW